MNLFKVRVHTDSLTSDQVEKKRQELLSISIDQFSIWVTSWRAHMITDTMVFFLVCTGLEKAFISGSIAEV